MRPKIIILCTIILIIGILLFIYGNNHYSFYEQKNESNTVVEIPNTNNNANVEKEMAFGTTVKFIGIFLLVLSILLFSISFFIKEK